MDKLGGGREKAKDVSSSTNSTAGLACRWGSCSSQQVGCLHHHRQWSPPEIHHTKSCDPDRTEFSQAAGVPMPKKITCFPRRPRPSKRCWHPWHAWHQCLQEPYQHCHACCQLELAAAKSTRPPNIIHLLSNIPNKINNQQLQTHPSNPIINLSNINNTLPNKHKHPFKTATGLWQ